MRILFLQKRLILPADTGGKIRTFNVLKHLARWHDITYLSNLLDEEQPWLDGMLELGLHVETVPWREHGRQSFRFALDAARNLVSRYPLNVDKDYDVRLRRRAEQLETAEQFDLLICDFVQMARNAIGLPIPSLLFQHNVEAQIFARQAERCAGPMAWYLRHQAGRMRRFEAWAGRQFDRVVAVSQLDQHFFESNYGWDHVSVIDTAVDTEYFQPPAMQQRESNHLVFVGSMDWGPNIQGVTKFVQNIWPTIVERIPSARLTVVGRNPTRSVRELASLPAVTVTGTVSDIRPFLHRAALGIVPIYSGSGTRLKIYEMMATGCPVISTRLGAEGLPLESDKHLVLADRDQEFAEKTVELLQNHAQRARLSETANQYVQSNFATEKVARQFEAACFLAVNQHPAPHRIHFDGSNDL